MTCYGLSLHFTYICAKGQYHKGISVFPTASLSSFFSFLSSEDTDISLDFALIFKLTSRENGQVGSDLMEVILVLKVNHPELDVIPEDIWFTMFFG